MFDRETLRRQLLQDMDRLHSLILEYASGDHYVKQEWDRMEGVLRLKMLAFSGMGGMQEG